MFVERTDTEINLLIALVSYQKVEINIYNIVCSGDDLVPEKPTECCQGQEKARESKKQPEKTWTMDG